MPPKKDTSKLNVKNIEEKETPFDPVPYETRDVCTSISLLLSPEKEIVTRALWVLTKYANLKEPNAEFLYKNGILANLLDLINYTDLTILRFTLKVLGQIVWDVPAAAKELSLEQYNTQVKQINHIFMTVQDPSVTEFSTQILSRVVKDPLMASYVFRAGVVAPIFKVLQTFEDADIQFNTLNFFYNVLEAREAEYVLQLTAEFSPRTLLCYLKSKLEEIREATMNIIEKITSWKSGPMQQLLRDQNIVEVLFKVILNPEFKALHKKSF
ncbi:hypothetical protein ILUMI_21024 [Ignelater luminosus]|uniref:Uncharacterized protein n=1 Tax=Ignelater luminosus TaxID=2038154 RepID=A0A8K0G4A8_IGNLU|nr:hypothetical protein ILUMI_21024 [Ignelater luminosus]